MIILGQTTVVDDGLVQARVGLEGGFVTLMTPASQAGCLPSVVMLNPAAAEHLAQLLSDAASAAHFTLLQPRS